MDTNKIGRRQLIITATGAGLGALLSKTASAAQPAVEAATLARNAGDLHNQGLRETSEVLKRKPINSEEGLNELIDHLVRLELINAEQAQILKDVVKAVFHSETVESMQEKIGSIYKQVQAGGHDFMIAFVGIARDSAAFIQRAASKIPVAKIIEFVASDIQGALTAAETSAKFPPQVRIACVIAGALSSSALIFFGKRGEG